MIGGQGKVGGVGGGIYRSSQKNKIELWGNKPGRGCQKPNNSNGGRKISGPKIKWYSPTAPILREKRERKGGDEF